MTAPIETENGTFAGQSRGRLVGWFANVLAGIREGQALARRYDELSRLSEAERVSRGVTRDDICRMVVRDCVRAGHHTQG